MSDGACSTTASVSAITTAGTDTCTQPREHIMQRITPTVNRNRIANAQDALQREDVAALLLGPSADLAYLTGFDAHESERMNLLIIPAQGDPGLVVPSLEAPLVGDAAQLVTLQTWADHDNP